MFSKGSKILSIVIALSLLVTFAGAVNATPTRNVVPVQPAYPPGYHPPVSLPMTALIKETASEATGVFPGNGLIQAQAAVLGKPGTVFAYSRTFGETEVPYFADFSHTYNPNGLAFGENGELYLVEESGARLIKFDNFVSWSNDHTPLWSVGKAGVHDWGETGLNNPKEVALDPDGNSVWVADNDIVSQFDAETGALVRHFPDQPWNVPSDEYRFRDTRGIAFDTNGNMYLSDMGRQRIQVFNHDVDGNPMYAATIWGIDSPSQIAIDGDDNLYVNDVFNNTVKQCTPTKTNGWPWTWDCSVFYGVPGEFGNSNDGTHLGWSFGLGVDRINHAVYIADGSSGNLISCTMGPGHTCDAIVQGMGWPADIAVDPTDGTLTVSNSGWNGVYRFFSEYNLPQGVAAGDPRTPWLANDPDHTPYVTDDSHFNMPSGIEVDALGNLYLIEESGQRMTKLDKNGTVLWNKGEPGLGSWDDTDMMDGPKAVAIDKRNILIVGGGGNHVRTYNALTGAYMDTLDEGGGDGLYQFGDVWGVATDSSNLIYVSDQKNNRVMVYSYNPTSTTQKFTYIRHVGMGGDCGNSNYQFCNPRGIFVDAAKNLYVADSNNCRVQMYNSTGLYKKTFGTGMCRDTFSSLGGPTDVAVDAQGRVYVAEEWNARVNVFDKAGAYLTTIAGNWGTNTGSLRNPRSVAVDKQGSVYVADSVNARVQKYASSVPFWTQANINGFGNRRATAIWALGTFKGTLYAGGANEYNQATIWKKVGVNWVAVMSDGFEDGANIGIDHLLEYKGYLYATTANCIDPNCNNSNGGQMWRSNNGLNWHVVVPNGFNDPANTELFRLAVLGGKLCVSTWRYDTLGSELWCSPTGEIGSWQREVENGFGVEGNKVITSMVDYTSPLPNKVTASYAATMNVYGYAHVWRKLAGADSWQPLWPTWPNDGRYLVATGLTVYNNYLYVMVRTQHIDGLPDVGGTIYRCQKCDGTDWSKALPDAMEDASSYRAYGMEATPNGLYAFFGNIDKGLDILWSKDGLTWTRPFPYGLGSSSNSITYWDNAILKSGSSVYLGTINYDNGGGIWKLCPTLKACK